MAHTDSTVLRDLELGDFNKGFLTLLSQLTTVGSISEEQFTSRWREIESSPDYRIVVIEDTGRETIVATAALIVERKFIHECGKVGHIEDVVVDASCRGQNLGRRLVEALTQTSKDQGCYKVILDCAESNVPFYEKCGFKVKEMQMTRKQLGSITALG